MSTRGTLPLAAAVIVWAALIAAGLLVRPPLPVDETRYLAVAWDMWRDGHYLVPHLNGIPYHHKPPLLFWLITAGWEVLGVSEAWARLVAPLFALGSLLLTAWLSRLLFPRVPEIAGLAPLILVGSAFFTLFASLTFFDMLLAFFTLLGLIGVCVAAEGHPVKGWTLFALALGLGVLSKGPVQLLDLATVPLLAPLWAAGRVRSWRVWYGEFLFAVICGAAIALIWAIPAAIAGGPDFAYMLFVGQTTERVVEALWHERPWWWYVPTSFLLVFPWLWWPQIWSNVGLRDLKNSPGVRFCLAMVVPVFVAFSAISGKQPHYLLPMLPVAAILLASVLSAAKNANRFLDRRWSRTLPLLPVLAIGIVLLALPLFPPLFDRARALAPELPPLGPAALLAGLGLIVLTALIALDTKRMPTVRAGSLTIATAAAVIAVQLAFIPGLRPRFDINQTALALARAQAEGLPIAHIDDYHGQYDFAGRLKEKLAAITADEALTWARAHPDGLIVDYRSEDPATYAAQPFFSHPYRGRYVVIWRARDVVEHGRTLLSDVPSN